ncbi:twin-arginine translocation signal domain-containing protein [Solwaraspora sp. WMMD937]|uniref:twin-arginine translocation signal domain-containing protein n=1 Tax=Solwaraspora sp. WMMD937 TaxID=3016090 RepID=UPI00249BE706|nr:twin-arginine translocation signal domain-containing protein [Solwaraspora sp. WMMD937]WFE20277.1 twin-arginine translocation signal domain-containing protein [Solwaraspora sp. WMMD937]
MSESYGQRPLSRRDVVRGAAVGGVAAAAAVGSTFLPESPAAAAPPVKPMPAPPAQPVAATAPTTGLLGLGSWLGTALKVANVAAQVLPTVLSPQQGNAIPSPFYLGDLKFEWSSVDGGNIFELYVTNNTDNDIGLSYSVTRSGQDASLSLHQPVRAHYSYKCQAEMSTFANGQVAAAPTPLVTLSNAVDGRKLWAVARSVGIGVGVNLLSGMVGTFVKDLSSHGFNFTLETNDSGTPVSVEVAATDKNGNTVNAKQTSSGPTATPDSTITIPLPPGVDLDPAVADMQLVVELEESDYQRLVADRLDRLIAI